MPLIDSPRLTDADRDAWTRQSRYDERLIQAQRLNRLEYRGVMAVMDWWAGGGGVCGVSWGKDSVIAAHLCWLSGIDVPLVWVRADGYDPPECETVRDAYLATHPGVHYEERVVRMLVPMRGQPGYPEGNQDVLGDAIRDRYVSGVRGSESTKRAMSVARLGEVTRRTCRPLAYWTAMDVWTYLAREHLPIHPAYAMSRGGAIPRDKIRVHMLASAIDTAAAWEDHYYGDVITAGNNRRQED